MPHHVSAQVDPPRFRMLQENNKTIQGIGSPLLDLAALEIACMVCDFSHAQFAQTSKQLPIHKLHSAPEFLSFD
jgi:hypothetical protein